MALSENSKSIISFWPGAKEEEERKEKELLKTRVRELEEEVGEIWVVPLKMLILGLLRLTIMAIKALLTKYLGPKLFQSTTYIPCKWKPKVEKLRGRAKKLAEMLEVVRSQVFSNRKEVSYPSLLFPQSYQVSLQHPICLSFIRET